MHLRESSYRNYSQNFLLITTVRLCGKTVLVYGLDILHFPAYFRRNMIFYVKCEFPRPLILPSAEQGLVYTKLHVE
jgi:hypothetical protein